MIKNVTLECDCSPEGSVDNNCNENGVCNCKPNITGDKCDEPSVGYYDFPDPKGEPSLLPHVF